VDLAALSYALRYIANSDSLQTVSFRTSNTPTIIRALDFRLHRVSNTGCRKIQKRGRDSRTRLISLKSLRCSPTQKCRPLATFQFRTRCRTGTALKITWDHVSKDCHELELPGEITKSGEPLTLPLVGDGLKDIAGYLRKQLRVAGKPICAVGDGATSGKESYRYNWDQACDKLGLGVFDKKTRR